MNPEQRLGEIVTALESVGISSLVMGGHAVRFYGLSRNTNDFDLHIAPQPWDDLAARLKASPLFVGLVEGPSWRSHAFKRFRIGTLPDGGDELLEFWRGNHLHAPHTELLARAQTGRYGDRDIRFLGLADLIRSKETARDRDWDDVKRLEEFLDARLHAAMERGEIEPAVGLAQLRSRAGFGLQMRDGTFKDRAAVEGALVSTSNPVTQAYLIPFFPDGKCSEPVFPIEPVVLKELRRIVGGSRMHLGLVGVVRNRYIQFRKDLDRRDKEAIQASLASRTEPA